MPGLIDSVTSTLKQAAGGRKKIKPKEPEPYGSNYEAIKKNEEEHKKKLRKKASQPDKADWMHH
jgi:hypothetical protein